MAGMTYPTDQINLIHPTITLPMVSRIAQPIMNSE